METRRGGGKGSRSPVEGDVLELVDVEVRRAGTVISRSWSLGFRPLAVFQAAEPVSSTLLLKFFRASSNPQRLSGIVAANTWLDPLCIRWQTTYCAMGSRLVAMTDSAFAEPNDKTPSLVSTSNQKRRQIRHWMSWALGFG